MHVLGDGLIREIWNSLYSSSQIYKNIQYSTVCVVFEKKHVSSAETIKKLQKVVVDQNVFDYLLMLPR